MDIEQAYVPRLLYVVIVALVIALAGIACAPTDDPFDIAQRKAAKEGTPTPTPPVTPGGTAQGGSATGSEATPHPDDIEAAGTIKLATWDDKNIDLENNIVGYVLVHGFNYTVELVDLPDASYEAALSVGDVDAVLGMSRTTSQQWYTEQTGSGVVIDTGSLFGPDSDVRIGVHISLKERAPEVVMFLQQVSPGEELLAELAANITEDRFGIKPDVAALMYLKNNRDQWTRWVPDNTAVAVNSAIERGKIGLRKGRCFTYYDTGCR